MVFLSTGVHTPSTSCPAPTAAPRTGQNRPAPHRSTTTVISNEAGRFFFFSVRSCERVGLRRETSAPSPTFFVSDEISLFFLLFGLDLSANRGRMPEVVTHGADGSCFWLSQFLVSDFNFPPPPTSATTNASSTNPDPGPTFSVVRAVGIEIESLHSKSRKRNDAAPPPLFNWSLLEPRDGFRRTISDETVFDRFASAF